MARQVSLRGKRFSALERFCSWRTTSIRSAASPRSSTLKDSARPSLLQCILIRRLAMEWNVPDHGRRTSDLTWATMRVARRVISSAARRVKVRSSRRSGGQPSRIRWATRWARVLVLPVPAPATISSGAAPAQAASRWRGLSFWNASVAPTAADYRRLLYILPVPGYRTMPPFDQRDAMRNTSKHRNNRIRLQKIQKKLAQQAKRARRDQRRGTAAKAA